MGSIPHEVRIRLCAAWIYALIGEEDAAIESLAQVVSVPWGWTMNRLLNDPTFDGLHDNPSFQALLRKDRSEDWRN